MTVLSYVAMLAAQFLLYPTAAAIMFAIFLWGLVRLLSQRSSSSSHEDREDNSEQDDFDDESEDGWDD